jgi:hypothetical protein
MTGHVKAIENFSNGASSHHSAGVAEKGRKQGTGSWISSIMNVIKPIWNTAATGLGILGGPEGKAVGMGMQALGGIMGSSNRATFGSDSYGGQVKPLSYGGQY